MRSPPKQVREYETLAIIEFATVVDDQHAGTEGLDIIQS